MTTNWRILGVLLVAVLATAACGEEAAPPSELPTADPADSEAPLTDLDALLEGAPDGSKLPNEAKADGIFPNQFDLVELQSPVRSQASRGVCSIFSTVALMEHLYIKEGTITDPDFSEQFLQWSVKMEVGAFKNTGGSSGSRNLEAIRRFGVVEEAFDPYETFAWGTTQDERCTGEDKERPTICFTNGEPDEKALGAKRWTLPRSRFVSSRVENIKAFMFHRKTAVIGGMTFFYQGWNHRSSKLPTNRDYWSEGYVLPPNDKDRELSLEKRAGHSILLVGWDDDLEVPLVDEDGKVVTDESGEAVVEKGFFLFKNSWGTGGFGVRNEHGEGYGYIAYSYIEEFASIVSSEEPKLEFDEEICDDGEDNNFDRRTDCEDPKCSDAEVCRPAPAGLEFINEEATEIPDNDEAGIVSEIAVEAEGFVESVAVTLEIEHSFQGDLQVTLISPDGRSAVLHDRIGAAGDGIKKTYAPTEMVGAQLAGNWTLAINDNANADIGKLVRWSLKFSATDVEPTELCDDGIDNIGNGLADCADPACAGFEACAAIEPATLEGLSEETADIPDNDADGISSTIELEGLGFITEVRVVVDITHSFRGDLTVLLVHPNGTKVTLHNQEGGSADDLVESYTLTDFNGASATGAWTLQVSDGFEADTGILNSWLIEADVE